MKDDKSSSAESSSEEERRSSREKTRGIMQVEPTDFPGQNVEPMQVHRGQTAYTSRRQKTESVVQVERTDFPGQNVEPTQVHTGQTTHLPTGSGMQVESLDPRSHLIQTACTPPSMAAQQEEDNGHQERRQKSSPDAAAYIAVDASARPISGRATAQHAEERTTMEKELSALQLIPETDLQSLTSTNRQQKCRIGTEAVIEQEPRGKSSALEISNQEQRSANEPEIAEQHQQLIASEETEIEKLRKLIADLSRRLTSDFYPTPYVGQGRSPTPGVAAGPEIQQPEVRLYGQYGDAYGPITTDLVSVVHQGTCSAYTPMEYSILHFRKFSALVASIMHHTLILMVYHTLHRKLKYDKSTKFYLNSSCQTVFPDNRK